jgi:cell division septation protein DedD
MAVAHVDSSMYLKAESMVSNGDAKAGRALVDSLVEATKPQTAQYAEGLYWRAKLSASADDAEQDYRRIIVEYSLSPRVADALLRLGQLELARGQRDKALQHFEQLTLEHSNSPLRAAASYWAARAYFEAGNPTKACVANQDAMSHVASSNVELKNQIDYQSRQCRGVQLASADTANTSGSAASDVTASDAARSVPVDAKPTVSQSDTDVTGSEQPDSEQTQEETSAATARGPYMVQVAAFKSKTQARALADGLKKKGYNVHVDGSQPLYRVRIGHYKTHAAAAAMLKKLQAKNIDGFVTKG